MSSLQGLILVAIFFLSLYSSYSTPSDLDLLLQIKSSLDPLNHFLPSWTRSADPCGKYFQGVACDEEGHVANISLQGMGLYGRIPPCIGELRNLTGLFLHFNALQGEIPSEISNLSLLRDLYLNVNNLSGIIPSAIGGLVNLQVLQLGYNALSGGIPHQLGAMKNLTVLALQHNEIAGAIPASLGNLTMLSRLDLGFNYLFGSIPVTLGNTMSLQVLDVRNNSLSGSVPPNLRRLSGEFSYENNRNLCGVEFHKLQACSNSNFSGGSLRNLPQSADLSYISASPSKRSRFGITLAIVMIFVAAGIVGVSTLVWYKVRGERTEDDVRGELPRKSGSPLINLEYSTVWDSLSAHCDAALHLEDIERATQSFSGSNLIERNNFSDTFKGALSDGTRVAVIRIAKTNLNSNASEFLKNLKILSSLRHENLLTLRGFCYAKGTREFFLVYDHASRGNLNQNEGILDSQARRRIIKGIARGMEYLHKKNLVHHNLSYENVVLDERLNPYLSCPCLHKLLADDVVFSLIKRTAADGYLAPDFEGRVTEKNDVYAYGVILQRLVSSEECGLERVARACVEACPAKRPSMEEVCLLIEEEEC